MTTGAVRESSTGMDLSLRPGTFKPDPRIGLAHRIEDFPYQIADYKELQFGILNR
jgi:hypothetical protein